MKDVDYIDETCLKRKGMQWKNNTWIYVGRGKQHSSSQALEEGNENDEDEMQQGTPPLRPAPADSYTLEQLSVQLTALEVNQQQLGQDMQEMRAHFDRRINDFQSHFDGRFDDFQSQLQEFFSYQGYNPQGGGLSN